MSPLLNKILPNLTAKDLFYLKPNDNLNRKHWHFSGLLMMKA